MSRTLKPALITTSWDDGHPLDVKLAEHLVKHGIRATFYTPRTSSRASMQDKAIRELSRQFEIGAHTMSHVDLLSVGRQRQVEEITSSKKWVEDVTSKPCMMFCPPLGRYDRPIVDIVREAGYVGLRTVELMSIASPRLTSSVYLLPTSLQLFNHSARIYIKNSSKRLSFSSLLNYARFGLCRTLPEATTLFVNAIRARGGCFHLWGHSWEIEEKGLWDTLDEVLEAIVWGSTRLTSVCNSGACGFSDAHK